MCSVQCHGVTRRPLGGHRGCLGARLHGVHGVWKQSTIAQDRVWLIWLNTCTHALVCLPCIWVFYDQPFNGWKMHGISLSLFCDLWRNSCSICDCLENALAFLALFLFWVFCKKKFPCTLRPLDAPHPSKPSFLCWDKEFALHVQEIFMAKSSHRTVHSNILECKGLIASASIGSNAICIHTFLKPSTPSTAMSIELKSGPTYNRILRGNSNSNVNPFKRMIWFLWLGKGGGRVQAWGGGPSLGRDIPHFFTRYKKKTQQLPPWK